jgi:7-cyano-7-deazaguanine synthase in queuosine biosynthesis
MTKVLLLHSAGIDSAAALHHLLSQQVDVLAVHVAMPSSWPLFPDVERYWVEQQWDWLAEQGFTFDTLIVENPSVVEDGLYSDTLLKAAATLFNADTTLTHIMSGRCAEDAASPSRDWDDGWTLFETMTGKTRDQVRMLSPFREQTKAQVAAGLPEEFIELLWGCFHPRLLPPDDPTNLENALQCEVCRTCLHYAAAGIREAVYWIEPPPEVEGPYPVPGSNWYLKRPNQEVDEAP